MQKWKNGIIHSWKSILIVAYLSFIIWAGFVHLFNKPYRKYTYPWMNWAMFLRGARVHTEQVLHGFFEDGSEGALDLASFFPMSPFLIYRGHGLGVTYGTVQELFNSAENKSSTLCIFVLDKYNQRITTGEQKLTALEIKFLYYPITPKGWWQEQPIGERVTARCTPFSSEELLWSPLG